MKTIGYMGLMMSLDKFLDSKLVEWIARIAIVSILIFSIIFGVVATISIIMLTIAAIKGDIPW